MRRAIFLMLLAAAVTLQSPPAFSATYAPLNGIGLVDYSRKPNFKVGDWVKSLEKVAGDGIYAHVDGAQTFGALVVNLHEMGCDSYSGSAHKWMMGPLEAGVLYVRAERLPQLWPSIVTAGWADNLKGARKLEVLGQRDDPRIAAFEAAVDFLNLIGMKNVEARTRALVAQVKKQLGRIPNLQLKTNMEPELSAGVVKFKLTRTGTKQAYDTLYEKHRIALAMTASGDSEGLRFSPHIYNELEEMDRAAAAISELA